jgi:hypothetical protein
MPAGDVDAVGARAGPKWLWGKSWFPFADSMNLSLRKTQMLQAC